MDFSFLDEERGLVGESWIVDIELAGELDEQGMVFDFGHVKKQIKQLIDAQADHRLLVPAAATACSTKMLGDSLMIDFQLKSGGVIQHRSPRDAVLLLAADSVSTHHVEKDLQAQLHSILPDNVHDVIVRLRPESITDAFFHYTHGLQMHQGQCQRIAHGHRSRIEIDVDGTRSATQEAQWAHRLADIYIATDSHLAGEFVHNDIQHVELAYTAAQGDFKVSLPKAQVFFMPTVSTVENIAHYLAACIAQQVPGRVTVKAFEGVGKGAFGRSASS